MVRANTGKSRLRVSDVKVAGIMECLYTDLCQFFINLSGYTSFIFTCEAGKIYIYYELVHFRLIGFRCVN